MTQPAAAKQTSGGRAYPIPHPETGEEVELWSVTRLLGLKSSYPLELWKQKTVAKWVASQKDLQLLAATDQYAAVRAALDMERSASNTGTGIHGLIEQLEAGTLNMKLVPDHAKGWLEQWAEAKRAAKLEVVASEMTVTNHELGYAGTFDLIATSKLWAGDAICDIKTGNRIYPDTSLQLAAYAMGKSIWDPIERRHLPMYDVSQTKGAIIHLQADSFAVQVVNLVPGAEAIKHLAQLRFLFQEIDQAFEERVPAKASRARKAPAKAPAKPAVKVSPRVEPELTGVFEDTVQRNRIIADIQRLSPAEKQTLASRWPAGCPTFKQNKEQTQEQLDEIDRILFDINTDRKINKAFPGTQEVSK